MEPETREYVNTTRADLKYRILGPDETIEGGDIYVWAGKSAVAPNTNPASSLLKIQRVNSSVVNILRPENQVETLMRQLIEELTWAWTNMVPATDDMQGLMSHRDTAEVLTGGHYGREYPEDSDA